MFLELQCCIEASTDRRQKQILGRRQMWRLPQKRLPNTRRPRVSHVCFFPIPVFDDFFESPGGFQSRKKGEWKGQRDERFKGYQSIRKDKEAQGWRVKGIKVKGCKKYQRESQGPLKKLRTYEWSIYCEERFPFCPVFVLHYPLWFTSAAVSWVACSCRKVERERATSGVFLKNNQKSLIQIATKKETIL